MGGWGSDNHYHWWRSKKQTVEDSLCLDANRWTREGNLRAGIHAWGVWSWTYASGSKCSIGYEVDTLGTSRPWARLHYTRGGSDGQPGENLDYRVSLTTTYPHLGGLRWWFICPLIVNGQECNRRVGKLYLPPGARYFGCRHCHSLTYTSCQESHKFDGLYRRMAANMGREFDDVKRAMSRIGKRR